MVRAYRSSFPRAIQVAFDAVADVRRALLYEIAGDLRDMSFEDRLIDREVADRRSRALQQRLKRAKKRHQDACFEEINLSRPRSLN